MEVEKGKEKLDIYINNLTFDVCHSDELLNNNKKDRVMLAFFVTCYTWCKSFPKTAYRPCKMRTFHLHVNLSYTQKKHLKVRQVFHSSATQCAKE